MRLILHIGVWKTGSSAIQTFLNRNAEPLARRGVLHPSFARRPGGRSALIRAANTADAQVLADRAESIAREATEIGAHTIVLSCEHYWPLSGEKLDRIAAALRPFVSSTKVVAFLRPQEELWGAILAQQAKWLMVRQDQPLWGDASYAGPAIANRGMYFSRCLKRFEKTFNAEVVPRLYQRASMPESDVVRAFLQMTGLDNGDFTFLANDANPSLGWKGVALSMAIAEENDITAGTRLHRAALVAASKKMAGRLDDANWMGRRPNFLTPDDVTAIRDHYAHDTARLSKRFFENASPFQTKAPATVDPFGADHLDADERAKAMALYRRALITQAPKFALSSVGRNAG